MQSCHNLIQLLVFNQEVVKLKSIVVEISRYMGSLNRMLDFFGGINARKKKGGIS